VLFASVTRKDERFPASYYLAKFKVAWNHSSSSDTLGSVQKQARSVSDTRAHASLMKRHLLDVVRNRGLAGPVSMV
jgi:hypothetical protein